MRDTKVVEIEVGSKWQGWALSIENYILVVEKVEGDKISIKYDEDQVKVVFVQEYGKDSDEYEELIEDLKNPRPEFIYETLDQSHLLKYYDKV